MLFYFGFFFSIPFFQFYWTDFWEIFMILSFSNRFPIFFLHNTRLNDFNAIGKCIKSTAIQSNPIFIATQCCSARVRHFHILLMFFLFGGMILFSVNVTQIEQNILHKATQS